MTNTLFYQRQKETIKVVIFEVCRSPEIRKKTEALILSQMFSRQGIDYELYSNDGIWPNKTIIDKDLIKCTLANPNVKIVHLALHGDDNGLVLKWSNAKRIRDRMPEDRLTAKEIKTSIEWKKKLIVSGACGSAILARFFLHAGAEAVIAPVIPIAWTNLAEFFGVFYTALFSGHDVAQALDVAITQFPEFRSYRVLSNY